MKIVLMMPEATFTTIGVPKRAEKYPSCLGPEPASAPMAISRSEPISQVVPLESKTKTIASAAMWLKNGAALPSTLLDANW